MHILARFLLVALVSTTSTIAAAQTDLLKLYKHLHAHPELSFQEEQTALRVASELRAAGFDVTEGVGGFGLVGLLKNGPGPTLMLRTDLDGLPVVEQTGLPYASKARAVEMTGQEVGVMHACGHDTHMTVVIGAARELASRRSQWSGTLMVIGQPAEERGAGARLMLADGLFERFPQPDFNLSVHGIATLPAGKVGYVPGWAMANVDSVDIIVHGIGGHGAYPHTAKDPVVLAAAIIMDLQTLVSREIHPISPGVVTVGAVHAGAKHNIISDRAELQLTVRSYSDEVRETLLRGIERVAINQARALGFPEDKLPEVIIGDEYTPAMWNDPALVARSVSAMKTAIGEANVIEVSQEMGGEDFSRYSRTEASIPSFQFRLGGVPVKKWEAAQRKELQLPSLHSPLFYPDPELTIKTGVAAMTATALELLHK